MSAGTSVRHSEKNPSPVEDVHFVQMGSARHERHRARLRAARHQHRADKGGLLPCRAKVTTAQSRSINGVALGRSTAGRRS
jgi:redox-sensitive bicupin YhaK (pirin superfamily)